MLLATKWLGVALLFVPAQAPKAARPLGAILRQAPPYALFFAAGQLYSSHQNRLVLWRPWTTLVATGAALMWGVKAATPSHSVAALVLLAVYTLAAFGHTLFRWHCLYRAYPAGVKCSRKSAIIFLNHASLNGEALWDRVASF